MNGGDLNACDAEVNGWLPNALTLSVFNITVGHVWQRDTMSPLLLS